jgi:hypothetical protein
MNLTQSDILRIIADEQSPPTNTQHVPLASRARVTKRG